MGTLVRPLWRAAAPGLEPLRLLRAQLVIYRKRATNYRALLWKMTYEDRASYDSMPPCNRGLDGTHKRQNLCVHKETVVSLRFCLTEDCLQLDLGLRA